MKNNNFFKFWLPVLLYSVVILILASLPQRSPTINTWSWILHIVEYTILGFLLARAFKNLQINAKNVFLDFRFWVILVGVGYALLDELYQHAIPYRVGEIKDIYFDTLGVILGGIAVNIFPERHYG